MNFERLTEETWKSKQNEYPELVVHWENGQATEVYYKDLKIRPGQYSGLYLTLPKKITKFVVKGEIFGAPFVRVCADEVQMEMVFSAMLEDCNIGGLTKESFETIDY